jgi:hypothetical protein
MPQVTLRPSGAGLYTEFFGQTPGSGAHYDKVDEAIADDFTTYLESQWIDTRELYDLPASGIPEGNVINWVKITVRAYGSLFENYEGMAIGFNDGVGTYWGDEINVPNGLWTDLNTGQMTTNPRTGLVWTLTQINALQIGMNTVGGFGTGDTLYVTQVFVEINYTEAPAGGNSKFFNFFD